MQRFAHNSIRVDFFEAVVQLLVVEKLWLGHGGNETRPKQSVLTGLVHCSTASHKAVTFVILCNWADCVTD
ncbi:Uncharacterized protein HZ326_8702 [Fusarium oxysporum f. sp. albedinis]|nr:Uncharacterized protein HZ326_8702 [Fusarium oxysporum f. sp. albedinis]